MSVNQIKVQDWENESPIDLAQTQALCHPCLKGLSELWELRGASWLPEWATFSQNVQNRQSRQNPYLQVGFHSSQEQPTHDKKSLMTISIYQSAGFRGKNCCTWKTISAQVQNVILQSENPGIKF